ncbi:MAG: NAD-dependent epimerase/dehydratase family protein, partial [Heyndrickxia sp.]
MKVLVTGGAGFIGSFIVEELVNKGHEAIVVDNLSTGKFINLSSKIPFYNMDINSPSIEQVFRIHHPEVVIHQAAQISVDFSNYYPFEDGNINILGTINLLQLCIKYSVSKIIFASSAAVYGPTEEMPIEETSATNPISFYGLSKYTAEHYIKLFHAQYGLNYTILRYSNVYGMRQNQEGEAGVISKFVNRMIHNQPFTVYGDGNQTRDFIFVRDVAKANIKAISLGDNMTLNISTGKSISVNQVIDELKKHSTQPFNIIYEERRSGDIKESYLSSNHAKQFLNW